MRDERHEGRPKRLNRDDGFRESVKDFWERFLTSRNWERATLTHVLGVDRSTVKRWCDGEKMPDGMSFDLLITKSEIDITPGEKKELASLWLLNSGLTDPGISVIQSPDSPINFAVRAEELSIRVAQVEDDLKRERHAYRLLQRAVTWAEYFPQIQASCMEIIRRYKASSDHPLRSRDSLLEQQIREHVLKRLCAFYSSVDEDEPSQKLTARAAIYTPLSREQPYVAIKWRIGLEDYSIDHDFFYIGPDPVPQGRYRGLAGEVYTQGLGVVVEDVVKVQDAKLKALLQRQAGRADDRKYKSLVHVPVMAGHTTYGALCIDSMNTFLTQDIELVSPVAKLLGEVLHQTGAPYHVDRPLPADLTEI